MKELPPHCCICIPGRACVERFVTCVRPHPRAEHSLTRAYTRKYQPACSLSLDGTSPCRRRPLSRFLVAGAEGPSATAVECHVFCVTCVVDQGSGSSIGTPKEGRPTTTPVSTGLSRPAKWSSTPPTQLYATPPAWQRDRGCRRAFSGAAHQTVASPNNRPLGGVLCAVRALCEKLAVLHHREFGKFRRLKGRH